MRHRQWGSVSLALALAAFAGLAAPAHGQDDVVRRIERALRVSDRGESFRAGPDTTLALTERTQLDVGGYTSFTALWLDDSSNNNRRLLQPEVGLYARANIDDVHYLFARAKFQYRTYSEGDSFDQRGDRWTVPYVDRYWYEFDLRRAFEVYKKDTITQNFNIRVGRQYVDWGASLALSEALYAARPTVEFTRNIKLSGLAAYTPGYTVGWDASQINFDSETQRGFFGGMLSVTLPSATEIYAYHLYTEDYNNEDRARGVPLSGVRFKYNSHYVGLGTRGIVGSNWEYLGEMVLQMGVSQTDPLRGIQQQEQVFAFAGRGQATYVFRDQNETRAQAEVLFASGDKDRIVASDTVGGNLAGTTDRAFNSMGFANTGLAFAPSLSNLVSVRAGFSTHPLKSVNGFEEFQVGVDGLIFNKFTSRGGIDEATTNDTFLGGEIDTYINYRVTSDLAFTVRYGVFFPGQAIVEKDTRHFILLGVTLSF